MARNHTTGPHMGDFANDLVVISLLLFLAILSREPRVI